MIWKVLATMGIRHATKRCRACAKPIPGDDSFGHSEEVCGPCRA